MKWNGKQKNKPKLCDFGDNFISLPQSVSDWWRLWFDQIWFVLILSIQTKFRFETINIYTNKIYRIEEQNWTKMSPILLCLLAMLPIIHSLNFKKCIHKKFVRQKILNRLKIWTHFFLSYFVANILWHCIAIPFNWLRNAHADHILKIFYFLVIYK